MRDDKMISRGGFLKTAAAFGASLAITPTFDKVSAAVASQSVLDGATVRRYCEESLKRLRVDSIPLFYQHRFDRNTSVKDVAGTIGELIQEGKVQR